MSAPLVVNTVDGAVWTRRDGSRDGEALYAPEKCGTCPAFVMVTLTELAGLGIVGSADVLPVPAGPAPESVLSLPWAHAMSDDDLHEFLGDLVSAAMGRWQSSPEVPDREVLAAVEKACAAWRTPGQGYRSDEDECACPPASRPHQVGCPQDGVPVASASFGERAAAESDPARRVAWRMLAEPEPEFDAYLRHPYRTGHDLPETGGNR